MADFATVAQLQAFWKTLDAAEQSRAAILLELASARLREIGVDVEVDVDAQVAGRESYAVTARWVVMEATKRAMLTPTDSPPADTWQQAAGPYSQNIKFSNPSGDLWFKKSELQAIGLHGNQSLSSISTSQNLYYDIYSS